MAQKGWLTKEERKKAGKVWIYHYYKTRETDGHRVENTVVEVYSLTMRSDQRARARATARGS